METTFCKDSGTWHTCKEEMQPFQTEFEIPQEVYEQADVYFGDKAESSDVRWRNFASYFIPIKSKEEISIKRAR